MPTVNAKRANQRLTILKLIASRFLICGASSCVYQLFKPVDFVERPPFSSFDAQQKSRLDFQQRGFPTGLSDELRVKPAP